MKLTGIRAIQASSVSFDCRPENSIELRPCRGIPPCEECLQALSFNPHPIPTQLPRGLRNSSFKRWIQSPWREIRRQALWCNRTEDWRRVSGARSPPFLPLLIFERIAQMMWSLFVCHWCPWLITGVHRRCFQQREQVAGCSLAGGKTLQLQSVKVRSSAVWSLGQERALEKGACFISHRWNANLTNKIIIVRIHFPGLSFRRISRTQACYVCVCV